MNSALAEYKDKIAQEQQLAQKRDKDDNLIRWYIIHTTSPLAMKQMLDPYLVPLSAKTFNDFNTLLDAKEKLARQQFDEIIAPRNPNAQFSFDRPECPSISEIYLPKAVLQEKKSEENQEAENKHKLFSGSSYLLMSQYVFVRASKRALRTFSAHIRRLNLELDATRTYTSPVFVDDEAMEMFKLCCEQNLDLEFLHNPFNKYTEKDYAIILTGPAKGCKGHIANIGTGGLKMVMRVGNWKFLLSNIHKYEVVVMVNNETLSSAKAAVVRLVDYYLEILKGHLAAKDTSLSLPVYATYREAPAILRELVKICYANNNLDALRKTYKSTSADTREEQIMATFFCNIDLSDLLNLNQFAQHCLGLPIEGNKNVKRRLVDLPEAEKEANLLANIPDSVLRPFLTITPSKSVKKGEPYAVIKHPEDAYTEYIYPVELKDNYLVDEKVVECVNCYYANFAVVKDEDGRQLLFSAWPSFYEEFSVKMNEISQQTLLERLDKYHCPTLHDVLDATTETACEFVHVDQFATSGLAIQLPDENNIAAAIETLLTCGTSICSEIMRTSRFRPLQRALCTVWVRRGEMKGDEGKNNA